MSIYFQLAYNIKKILSRLELILWHSIQELEFYIYQNIITGLKINEMSGRAV